jgi:hypothetical protein
MTDRASADTLIAIDRVDRARGDGDGIRLRLSGRWLGSGPVEEHEPLLVIQLQGRRHRFPANREEAPGGPLPTGSWEATFTVPQWAEPSQDGQAALWVGTDVVPVPLAGSTSAAIPSPDPGPPAAEAYQRPPAPPALGEARAWPSPLPSGERSAGDQAEAAVDSGRPGPLAELLFKESVSALHVELEQRSAEAARLRGALSDAQSELEARTGMQAALESAHTDLRGELQDLMSAVTVQREDFERRFGDVEERLAVAESERDAVREELESERAGARRELESVRADARRELEAARADAERELESERADARRELEAARVAAQRDAEAERASGRSELEAERARATEQLAELTAARDAATRDAATLSQRVAAVTGTHQQYADELAALREQLATAQVSREAAAGEVVGLRAELDRLGSELAVSREQMSAQGGDLGEAQRLLADARALTEQLRGQNSQ